MRDIDQLSPDQIRQFLLCESGATHDIPNQWGEHECQQAAVLIPFVREKDAWHLLFIRRAQNEQDHHSGQVAFAGGKFEKQDSNLHQTALREAHEEIGLHPDHVTILGELDCHHSISRFRITPVVAHMDWPYELILDDQEVARAFTIPLRWLADSDNYRIEQHQLVPNHLVPVVYYDEYDGELLWGATARMTLTLVSLFS